MNNSVELIPSEDFLSLPQSQQFAPLTSKPTKKSSPNTKVIIVALAAMFMAGLYTGYSNQTSHKGHNFNFSWNKLKKLRPIKIVVYPFKECTEESAKTDRLCAAAVKLGYTFRPMMLNSGDVISAYDEGVDANNEETAIFDEMNRFEATGDLRMEKGYEGGKQQICFNRDGQENNKHCSLIYFDPKKRSGNVILGWSVALTLDTQGNFESMEYMSKEDAEKATEGFSGEEAQSSGR
jgi:hypothetical protein